MMASPVRIQQCVSESDHEHRPEAVTQPRGASGERMTLLALTIVHRLFLQSCLECAARRWYMPKCVDSVKAVSSSGRSTVDLGAFQWAHGQALPRNKVEALIWTSDIQHRLSRTSHEAVTRVRLRIRQLLLRSCRLPPGACSA